MTGKGSPFSRATFTRTRLALLMLGAAGVVSAGPIDPPSGPVESTFKTLSEVEPRIAVSAERTPGDADSVFRIVSPGSYYLTGNVTALAGTSGIEIATGDVTLDLMGFKIVGKPDSLDGIVVPAGSDNVTIRNGIVAKLGRSGIDLAPSGLGSRGSRVEGVSATENGEIGIRGGASSVIVGCTATLNGSSGIVASSGSVIERCASRENQTGIAAGDATVRSCAVNANRGHGLSVVGNTTVAGCVATGNGGTGILCSFGASLVVDCNASLNTLSGINVVQGCTVLNNHCDSNGNGGDGAGILVSSDENRLDGNTCTRNDRGIDVDSAGNLVVRNSVSGNGVNFDIVGGNDVGPIGSAATATSPWANIQF